MQRAEIVVAHDADQRREQVLDQRADDGAEGGADDDRDSQVDRSAAEDECLEVLDHSRRSFPVRLMNTVSREGSVTDRSVTWKPPCSAHSITRGSSAPAPCTCTTT